MTKGLPKSLSRGAPQRQTIIRQTIKMKDVPVTVSGLTGIGFGTVPIGELPQGNILFNGAVAYLQLSTASANVIAAFTGAFSIGTAPTADATLSGSEVDIIPQTTLSAATAKVSPRTRATHAVAVSGTVYDNTDDSLELNANILIDDASVSADGNACLINGEIVLSYIVLLDD